MNLSAVISEQDGINVYNSNPIFQDIGNFMEHPLTRDFYTRYMGNKQEQDSILYLLWVYRQIEKNIPSATPYEKLAILEKCIKTGEIRQQLCQTYSKNFMLCNE